MRTIPNQPNRPISLEKIMKQIIQAATIALALALCINSAAAQNTPTPKPEDAEKNAFQTPTTGKQDATEASKQTKSGSNPESRLNDEAPAHEKNGTSNTPSK
jgi:hypothetical protein